MRRSGNRALARWPSICLLVALLGALGVLGHALHEASHAAHRHLIDGEVVAHDHLDAGPHDHVEETPASPRDEDGSGDSRDEDQVYLGQITTPMVDESDDGPVVAEPRVWSSASSAEAQEARPSPDRNCPPGRGPPAPLFATDS
jgi:hypothetical protein